VHLDLVEREDVFLEEAVVNGEIDCAVVTAWGSPRVASTHVLTEEILLLVPIGHKLASGLPVSMSALCDESLLLPSHSMNMSNLLTDYCHRAGFEPRVPHRANYFELTKALVRQGLGIALVPKMLISIESLDGLVAVPLEEHPVRSLNLIYLREHPLATAARALMIHIRASIAGHAEMEANIYA
jgi:DNA-binding transcriptional LysR family regulator